MVVASGFVEVNALNDVEKVVDELKLRGIEVSSINEEKIVFLIERESNAEIKKELDSLKETEGVRSVYLAYYSLEGADESSPR